MEATKKILDENRMLLIVFSAVVMVSIVLILFKSFGFNLVPERSGVTEFQLTLTPEFIIVESSHSIMINPCIASESDSRIRIYLFPLKLPRFIRVEDETIKIKTWSLEISNVLLLEGIETNGSGIIQRARIIDLKINLIEESEKSLGGSCFTFSFEKVETPHEVLHNRTLSGSLDPLTGQLYGGFYLPSKSKIKMIITWDRVDKPILLTLYNEKGEAQHYTLTGGEWTGSVETVEDGLNYLIIGNPNQTGEKIGYSITILG